ncbi:MAG: hypothetical protein N838_34870 [Thiohalocapsa sp. PB-PSB1]|nr:MAG: hypothetical protein N838_34870 [Thiohalocapsa sp. PB-PSB1]
MHPSVHRGAGKINESGAMKAASMNLAYFEEGAVRVDVWQLEH